MVAAEGHEVSLPGGVESFQSPWHKASLRLGTSPLKPKNTKPGLSGLPAGIVKYRDPSLGATRERLRGLRMTSNELRKWEWGPAEQMRDKRGIQQIPDNLGDGRGRPSSIRPVTF